MGFLFTFLYVVISYLTPPTVFGPLAAYHVEVLFAFLAVVFSIPSLSRSGLLRTAQTLGIAGMAFAVAMSIAVGGWLGGAVYAFYGFMQPAFTFYLVAVNCKSKRHFQWIILALVASSAFFMVHGIYDLRNDVVPSLYLYGDGTLRRLRGLGFVHDPNDFSQVLVSLIPCLFFWRQKSRFANIFLVGIPLAILLTGMYLTHSRGAILALLSVVIVSARRKIGTVPSLILAGALLSASFAINWSGGRDISVEGGADRLALWGEGLQLIKTHPLFGVGVGAFGDYTGLTAHNSIVVCAAETGLTGLYFWVLFVFSTIRLGVHLGFPSRAKKTPDETATAEERPWVRRLGLEQRVGTEPSIPENGPMARARWHSDQPSPPAAWAGSFPPPEREGSQLSVEEAGRLARLLIFALTGMLVAGWFISREFSQWLFLYCGMMYAVSRLRTDENQAVLQDKMSFLLKWSAVISVALLFAVYAMLRLRVIGA